VPAQILAPVPDLDIAAAIDLHAHHRAVPAGEQDGGEIVGIEVGAGF
jgi:hypothetical protein